MGVGAWVVYLYAFAYCLLPIVYCLLIKGGKVRKDWGMGSEIKDIRRQSVLKSEF